ncbi:tripartite tricarboxylate transporter substrate binding protein [Bradyrhizobium sp. LHD-71]|uniref:Bug family tripartite tricarboxylate transporter substrate binding protein n=1 Tax=Bradyrhizobium sp. LHD-71 TaxID=3072141 RepID=UPI00280E7A3F|nr:tripartite tricarboxylate transporter substrate binding protein [Bradyrhizobium sp. LHD-71]MDQ8730293.1 tripartite tricarboxylate transporter substrate binding protein [Bradyrhizobium sp. LHD-71]
MLKLSRLAWLCLAAVLLPAMGFAQDYPTRPIKLIVPFPAGGPADTIARVYAQRMQELLGQPVIIDNRGGAGGITGVDAVAKAEPNGYTIGISSPGALAINPSAQTSMPYNVQKDLAPIGLVVRVPEILVVAPNVKASTVAELLALSKAQDINFASTGAGSMPHLAAELFKLKSGVKSQHVPYRGAAPAVNDLLGSQVQWMFADIPVLLPHVKAGTFKALGIGSTKRSPALPDLKTFAEQGLPDVLADNWYGLIAPAGTPKDIIAKLNRAANEAAKSKDVIDKLAVQGVDAEGSTPEAFAKMIDDETKKWGEVIRASGVKLEL